MNTITQYSPILVIAIPIIAALIVHLFTEKTRGWFAFLAGAATLVVASFVMLSFLHVNGIVNISIAQDLFSWAPTIATNFSLLIDGLSVPLVFFAAFLGTIGILYSISYMSQYKSTGPFYSLMLLSIGTAIGALLSANLIMFVFFWKIVGVTLFGLINLGKTENKEKAAWKSLMMVSAADYAMIIGIIIIFILTGTFYIPDIAQSLGAQPISGYLIGAALALFIIGPITKAAGVPLHTWLADAAAAAPTPAVAMLPAAIEKILGIYLLVRISYYLFTVTATWNIAIATLGSLTMVIGVMMALIEDDVKRLLGFHAISQVGYMILAVGIGSPLAIAAGIFHLLNNALYKMSLFLGGGAVQNRTGTKNLNNLGGLAKNMPITALTFVICALAISGVPPFNGFASKWLIYTAAIQTYPVFAVIALIVSSLTLASFIKLSHSMFYGRRPAEYKDIKEVPKTMTVAMGILAFSCVLFGIFPQIPLNYLILPGLGALGMQLTITTIPAPIYTEIGAWGPAPATLMLLAALIIGAILYGLTRVRVTKGEPATTYSCGEDLPSEEISVTSHHFYYPVKQTFKTPYNIGKKGGFDIIYGAVVKAIIGFTQIFRKTHTGILTTYVSWIIIFIGIACYLALGGI